MPYNFVADSIHTKNFVADFLQVKCNFRQKTAVLRFWAPPPWAAWGQRTVIILGLLESAKWTSYFYLSFITLQQHVTDDYEYLRKKWSPKSWTFILLWRKMSSVGKCPGIGSIVGEANVNYLDNMIRVVDTINSW